MLPPTGMVVDTAADEVFVSDGELQFHRHVIVFNSETGAFKRMWGPTATDRRISKTCRHTVPTIRHPSSSVVHTASRCHMTACCTSVTGSTIDCRSFRRTGPSSRRSSSPGTGSVYDSAFSADPEQRFLYIADGMNKKVWTLLRESREVVGRFSVGRNNGVQFNHPHSIATNSNGHLYVTETLEGK